MADQLTTTGLEINDLQTRISETVAAIQSAISPIETCPATEPTGQLVRIPLEKLQQVAELLQAVHDAFDPDDATGLSLEALCAITGTVRQDATYGTAPLSVNLDGGTTLPAGSIAGVGTDTGNRWATDSDVVAPAGPAAAYAVTATCTTAGAVAAPSGTITSIVTSVAGWNSVTSTADATVGLARQTDPQLRSTREDELAAGGSATVDAIRTDVSQVDGVIQAVAYQNTLPRAVDGMPPNSVEAVIWDGAAPAAADADVAEAIFAAVAGGPNPYGTTSYTVTDDQGNDHAIGFTRATQKVVELNFVLSTDSDYPGHVAFKAAVVAWGAANLGIADDVIFSRMYDVAFAVDGVLDVTTLQIRFNGGVYGTANLAVGGREIATIATGDVAVA